ncbi:MAG: MgtC/SapB family protein [Phycisphaerales bacterium]|nr:MgtC/SapB family protein [Phycisphaerales bacterium]
MSSPSDFTTLGISLGLGLLVGLQRERSKSLLAGIRTFPLVTLLGTLSAMLAEPLGIWFPAAALIGVMGLAVVGNLPRPATEPPAGITTEAALLLMFAVGAQLVHGPIEIGITVAAVAALLLHIKAPLHAFVARLGDKDLRAIMQFVLIAMVILPILPDRSFGPFNVFNPRNIWLVVVLVVGMSLAGYVAFRLFGARAGAILGGVLGGLVSSTATTASYSRRVKDAPEHAGPAALVIVLATAVVYGRIIAEIAAVAPSTLWQIAPPILVMGGVAVVSALAFLWKSRRTSNHLPEPGNPSQLRSALYFAGLYSLVLLAVAAARTYLGHTGLYAVAGLSGLTDMDAITLSTARMADRGELNPILAGKLIIVAAMANLIFKAGIAATLGGARLFRTVAVLFALQIATAAGLLLFAPRFTAPPAAAQQQQSPDQAPTPTAPGRSE